MDVATCVWMVFASLQNHTHGQIAQSASPLEYPHIDLGADLEAELLVKRYGGQIVFPGMKEWPLGARLDVSCDGS